MAETKKCQDKLADNNDELRQVNHAIAEISKILYSNINNTRQYLFSRHNSLNNEINNCTRERDEKLNEAMSKALDIVDDGISNGVFSINSLGNQAMGLIFNHAEVYNIRWHSLEVNEKFS